MTSRTPMPPTRERGSRPGGAVVLPRRVPSRELFAGRREVRIDHEGVEYRLNLTRQGKLILTR